MVGKSMLATLLIGLLAVAAIAAPPKEVEVASGVFENVADNGWTTLEFDPQPPGEYYLEMSDLIGASVGCWGAQADKYPDGTAYQDGEALTGDFRLQYTPSGGTPVELVVIEPQGAIGDDWYPFGLHEAQESMGQTFIAPEEFVAVAFQTPTWVTADSGCTLTLYSASAEAAAEPAGKLAATWGNIKSVR